MHALANEPAAEKTKIYEKSVPDINPCPKTLKITTRNVSLLVIFSSERRIGRLASPRRRNGSGFGIAYSIADRKRQRAVKKDSNLVLFSAYIL
jgi:hypothetical protein